MSKIIMTRQHRHYKTRIPQLHNNILAKNGGHPYIDARLCRAPNESTISWKGSETEEIPGRKQRAFLVNDAGRVVSKIEQYLFANSASRDGIDPQFSDDATTTGLTIDSFWREVCNLYTAGQWVWLQADRGSPSMDPETGRPRPRTLAEREAAGDRIYWSIWPSTDVVDWRFDTSGNLLWLICTDTEYENNDPMVDAKEVAVRKLWKRGTAGQGATWTRYIENSKHEAEAVGSGSISIQDVPFEILGVPSSLPWWFDDIEMIQAALMNIASLNNENLVKTVYPQLVVPTDMVESLESKLVEQTGMQAGRPVLELVREIIRGMDRPFVESVESKDITRYLQPSAADLKALPEEEDRRRKQLFDVAGLALFNRETKQVQSAESKQFDHLDTESTIQNRAILMQEVENKMVALSKKLDSNFKEYTAEWPSSFDVPQTTEDVEALVKLGNFTELTPGLQKQIRRMVVKLLDQIDRIPSEAKQALMAEIDSIADSGGFQLDPSTGGFLPNA